MKRSPAPVRLVLDTNILVSALISSEGYPGRVLRAAKREGSTLITSTSQIDELQDVLAREHLRHYIQPEEARSLLATLEAAGEVVDELPEVSLSAGPERNGWGRCRSIGMLPGCGRWRWSVATDRSGQD